MSTETRLALDMSHLYAFLVPLPFRLTPVARVLLPLRPGCWLASLDLRFAFGTGLIPFGSAPFLVFLALGQVFQFSNLPFGLNIAPRQFTKLLLPVRSILCVRVVHSPWVPPPPSLTLSADALDWGWGCQTSVGLQGSGSWPPPLTRLHIFVWYLRVFVIALHRDPALVNTSVLVLLHGQVTVRCGYGLEWSGSFILPSASVALFGLTRPRSLHLSPSHFPGVRVPWADAWSRQGSSSVEWTLVHGVSTPLPSLIGLPHVDQLVSVSNHHLDRFLMRSSGSPNKGSGRFPGGLGQVAVRIPVPHPVI